MTITYTKKVIEKDFTNLDKYAITKPYSSAVDLYLKKLENCKYNFANFGILNSNTSKRILFKK